MSYKTELKSNNADLEAILAAVNALPEAGGGEAPDPVIEPLDVTENGTYTAPDGVDGYSPVTVNVPIPEGYIIPSGTKNITENGVHDVKEYESVAVDVPTEDLTAALDSQEAKLNELLAVLDGKAAGGGSSGGGSVETCTVRIEKDEGYPILAVQMRDGIPLPYYSETYENDEFEAPCGSEILIYSVWDAGWSAENLTEVIDHNYLPYLGYFNKLYVFRVDALAGGLATINIWEG